MMSLEAYKQGKVKGLYLPQFAKGQHSEEPNGMWHNTKNMDFGIRPNWF